jgi:uncharacterized caspase-like protein
MSEGKAFIIGIQEYQRREISKVDFAEADAHAVADGFKYSGLSEDNTIVLLSASATKTTIESKLRTFMTTVSESDQLFFFYAGHGFAVNSSNFITCYDTQPEDLSNTSISLQDLFTKLRASKCRRIIIFLDSCHSGLEIFQGMRQLHIRSSTANFSN